MKTVKASVKAVEFLALFVMNENFGRAMEINAKFVSAVG